MALDLTISKEDEDKINYCDFYVKSKAIIKAAEEHKLIELGTAYMLSYKDWEKKDRILGGDEHPDKYVIIKNDEGFLFAKRIISGGVLGKQITCLTIEHLAREYTLIPDPSHVDAILLDDEANYDVTADAKSLASRKNKSRRINEKKRFTATTEDEILKELKDYKVGDKFWSSSMAYCDKIEEWEITKVTSVPCGYYRSSNFKKNMIEFHVKNTDPKSYYHSGTTKNSDEFVRSTNSYNRLYYKIKPTKLEDVII